MAALNVCIGPKLLQIFKRLQLNLTATISNLHLFYYISNQSHTYYTEHISDIRHKDGQYQHQAQDG